MGYIEKDDTFRSPSDAKSGHTDSRDNIRSGSDSKTDKAVLHSHTPKDNGMVDDTKDPRTPLGDSQPVSKGYPTGTVTPDGRVGVHEQVDGRLQFRMINGIMTKPELKAIQENLNIEQKLIDSASK